nr:glutaredoxin domain-containing protein [uncultured Allomuricauda sp.]
MLSREKEICLSRFMHTAMVMLFCLSATVTYAQPASIKVVETKSKNRITFFAENKTYADYDVLFEVKGKNFRQSAAKPRWIRVPAASKVHLKTIILLRDKTPVYSKIFKTSDSLSKRAVKKEYTKLDLPPPKVKPKKQITIYTFQGCDTCDSIVSKLNTKNFLFRSVSLDKNPEVKEQLAKYLSKSTQEMDSLSSPIISLGGRLYSWITNFDQMMEELEKD